MAEKKKKDPFSHAWLKWLILGVFAYAFYMHYTGKVDNIPSTTGHRDKTPSLINRASRPATPLPDIPDRGITVLGDIAGTEGDVAQCGQVAKIRAEGSLPDGTPIEGLPDKESVTLHIGDYGKEDSWKAAFGGMRPGGIRQITLPAERLGDVNDKNKQGVATFKLSMESLSPSSSPDEVPFLAVDTASGGAGIAFCGDEVTTAVTLFGPDGTQAFTTEKDSPLTFHIGSGAYLYGLDRGIIGMHENAARIIIIPPAYAISLAKDASSLPDGFPQGKMLVAEVRLLALKKGASE